MNTFDRMFWILFVFLEVAVMAATAFAFSPVLLIVGFAVIVAGFAKVGEHAMHESVRSEVIDNRKKMDKITNWLMNQYELTQGVKTLHDSRFHRIDKKRSEIEEDIEKRYRELAGKIIDVENRLSLVSRAVISQSNSAAAAMQKKAGALQKTADSVWEDVTELAGKSKTISTLSRGVKNTILGVHPEKITLRSELTKKEREILKEEFGMFWEMLSRKKELRFPHDVKDPAMVRAGSIIISFLARLPYVEHSVKPRALYLMDKDTHALGTLKAYA
jgi:hypothetical protein